MFFSFFIAILLSFFAIFIFFGIKSRLEKKHNLNNKHKQAAQNCALQLRFSDKKQVINYFEKLISKKEKVSKYKNYLETKEAIFVPYFFVEKICLNEFSKIYAQTIHFSKTIIILSNSFDNNVYELVKNIKNKKFCLLDNFATYEKYIKEYECYPNEVINTTKQKIKLKELFFFMLKKDKTKNYFFLGLVLIVSSFFVWFKIYYLVSGSILLLLAVITIVLPYIKKQKSV